MTSADTSFLYSLYGNDVHTPRALAWVRSSGKAIRKSDLGDFELANALRFAVFRGFLSSRDAGVYWAHFEADREAGRVIHATCNLARVVSEAKRISATHTIAGGHRAFDILHVAAALVMHSIEFLTFDENQKRLAQAERLVVPC